MRAALLAICLIASAAPAAAQSIIGNGDPASAAAFAGGSTQLHFNDVGTYATYSSSGVTFSGPVHISSAYANHYNTSGTSLDNYFGDTTSMVITFDYGVGAFAFNFGASDSVWTLSAYSGATLLDTLLINPTYGSNNGAYFGLSGSNITSATLATGNYDYVFVDNFTFTTREVQSAVPEPATWAFMLLGFGAVGGVMRRRRKLPRKFLKA